MFIRLPNTRLVFIRSITYVTVCVIHCSAISIVDMLVPKLRSPSMVVEPSDVGGRKGESLGMN